MRPPACGMRMRCSTVLMALLCAAVWGPCPSARAAQLYDPAVVFRTLQSTHVAVHFPPGMRNFAVETARMAEDILATETAFFGFTPKGRIEIILEDFQDATNGLASVMPKNTLRLYVTPPVANRDLWNYQNWLRTLLTHELAHICDLDHTEGWNRGLRHVFGKVIQPNAVGPQFFSEGVAVFAETLLTDQGRGRSAYVDTVVRMAAIQDRFPHLDQANNLWAHWPFGSVSYFYGGRFHLYLAARFGKEQVTQWHTQHSRQVIPYLFFHSSQKVFGQPVRQLWQDFKKAEVARATAQVQKMQAQGVTQAACLTHGEHLINAARYVPKSDQIVYSRMSPKDGASVRVRACDGLSDRVLARDTFSSQLAISPDGRWVVFSAASLLHRFDTFNELYVFDLKHNKRHRLADVAHPKESLRGRDPAFSPDGNTLLFVQMRLGQSYLVQAPFQIEDLGHLPLQVLQAPAGDTQHSQPNYAPDGKTLVESVHFEDGKRDIVLLDAQTGAHKRRLTFDTNGNQTPIFSADGQYVVYASEADGTSQLFAVHLSTSRYFRITRRLGGAYQPAISSDGCNLLFLEIDHEGLQLRQMPWAPATWEPLVYAPNAGGYVAPTHATLRLQSSKEQETWAQQGVRPKLWRGDAPAQPLRLGERETAYHAGPSLAPWHDNWVLLPQFTWINNDPSLLLETFGQDALAYHQYTLAAGTSYFTRHPNVYLNYQNDRFFPTLSWTAFDLATLYNIAAGRAIVVERRAQMAVGWSLRNRHQLGLSYRFAHTSGNRLASQVSLLGRQASLLAAYQYHFTRQYNHSVGRERGQGLTFSVKYDDPYLGGQYRQWLLHLDMRGYVNNPLWDNHVLALRLVTNRAYGPDRLQSFLFYGTQGVSILSSQSEQLLPLRGFWPSRGPLGAPAPGTANYALYAEYRWPLLQIQRGLGLFPIFFQRLHMAAFADAGNTWEWIWREQNRVSKRSFMAALQQPWLSTGIELRSDIVLAWNAFLTVRVGMAVPTLAEGRAVDVFAPLFYLDIGSSI